ncbi:MAG: amidohydrolase family protein [Opitutaceae bacterium]|nr:amidohydrolase family protein [Opitutaceae bacterium]
MRAIDCHVHLYPSEAGRDPAAWAAEREEPHWAVLCTRRRRDGRLVQGFPSVDELLRDLDAAGIAKAVLLGWYWERHLTCFEQNKFYAECVRRHPDRLAAFATVQPAAGDLALVEARRAHGEGLIGLGELSPHSQGFSVNLPAWHQLLDLAAELNLPVNLHVSDPAGKAYPGRVDTPLEDFVRMAREHPRTTFILAHWGGGLAWAQDATVLANVWYDTAASPLLYGPEVWTRPLTDRVLFGSDYPLVLYPREADRTTLGGLLGEARAAGVPAAYLGGNAARLLKL